MKVLSSINLKNKTVLLRSDLNSDLVNGRILLSERIKQASGTIKFLKEQKAKIVIISHQGNPGDSEFSSLKQHAKFLNKFTKVKFVEDIIGKKAEKAIKELEPGEAILLENIRFLKEEYKPSKNRIVKFFLPLVDLYVNDAFSNSHRNHTSMISLPKYISSCAGPLVVKELNALKNIKIKDCLLVLGGAKPKENIKLLNGRKVLACGLFGQLCLIVKGKNLGAQNLYLKKGIKNYDLIIKQLKSKIRNVQTPVDFAVKINGKRKEFFLEDFPSKYEIFDIGKKTQEMFIKEIKNAKAVYMKGPAGHCADKNFCAGTFSILKAVAESKCFSLIGGGHLSDAIERSGISKNKFSHVSLSGGALLNYIAGEKLPGIEVLK